MVGPRLLHRRTADAATSTPSRDGCTLALVIEGGGLRGVIAAGMATGLHRSGAGHVFDMVIGTSAGATVGAFLLSDQPDLGTSVFCEDVVGAPFLSWRRALIGRPPVDLDLLYDQIIAEGPKRLDAASVLRSPTRLLVTATHARTARPVVRSDFDGAVSLLRALRASAAIPLLGGARSWWPASPCWTGPWPRPSPMTRPAGPARHTCSRC